MNSYFLYWMVDFFNNRGKKESLLKIILLLHGYMAGNLPPPLCLPLNLTIYWQVRYSIKRRKVPIKIWWKCCKSGLWIRRLDNVNFRNRENQNNSYEKHCHTVSSRIYNLAIGTTNKNIIKCTHVSDHMIFFINDRQMFEIQNFGRYSFSSSFYSNKLFVNFIFILNTMICEHNMKKL